MMKPLSCTVVLARTAALVLCAGAMASCGGGGGGGSDNASAPGTASPGGGAQLPAREALIARARALELNTPYVPPPGNVLEHHTSGYAKTLCSAVFITGLDPAVAADSVGYFTGAYEQRQRVGKPEVDRERKEVRIPIPGGPTVVARRFGSQGCVTLPPGADGVYFTPSDVRSALPDAASQPWPQGDQLPGDVPSGYDTGRAAQAADAAFALADAHTTAFVATYKGRVIAERYMPGITRTTPLESWSMGKSVVATLMGVLMQQGAYRLDQPAPIPEWQTPGDPRQQIRIADILHMSSGLRIKAPDDPDFDPAGTYPDHTYLYTGRIDTFNYAATRPQQWPPDTVGRYRNTDPVLASYLVRLAVEKRGEDYHAFPQRQLFDRIGIRSMVMETDPYGNFLTQGYEFMAARDWARLGNLYLQDGVWNGERILPEGFVRFVSTVAPAWAADKRPIYGGFFWINGAGAFPALPASAYYMLGAGGQFVIIVPSHDLVVVRMGFDKGSPLATAGLQRALALLMEGLPRTR